MVPRFEDDIQPPADQHNRYQQFEEITCRYIEPIQIAAQEKHPKREIKEAPKHR
ncbi:hypothetical protein D3C73_1309840 [compost metagenome]